MGFIFFLLFITPFIVGFVSHSFFEAPKVLAVEAGILLFLAYSIVFQPLSIPKRSMFLMGISVIFGLTLLHLCFFRTEISFFGNETRLQGIFLLWCLLLWAYLSKNYSIKNISWKVYAVLLSIHAVVLFISPLSEDNRFVGFFGEPNAFAAYILFLWPFLYFSLKKWGRLEKVVMGLAMSIVLLILFLTHSKSALVGLSLQLTFLFIIMYFKSYKKAILICALLYCCSYALPFFSQALYENRVDVWHTAVLSGAQSPFVGNGFGNTEIAMGEVVKNSQNILQDYYVDSAHNIFLDWWVQGGIIGVTSLILLLTFSIKTFLKKQMTQELVLLIGLITVLSFNPASVVSLVGLWWVIGRGWK